MNEVQTIAFRWRATPAQQIVSRSSFAVSLPLSSFPFPFIHFHCIIFSFKVNLLQKYIHVWKIYAYRENELFIDNVTINMFE